MHACIHTYTHTYSYIHTHTYIHTYTHTYIYNFSKHLLPVQCSTIERSCITNGKQMELVHLCFAATSWFRAFRTRQAVWIWLSLSVLRLVQNCYCLQGAQQWGLLSFSYRLRMLDWLTCSQLGGTFWNVYIHPRALCVCLGWTQTVWL